MDPLVANTGSAEQLYRRIASALEQGDPAVLVTVIAAGGSTPRDVGAKLLFESDGRVSGSVGGGPLEQLARAEAERALATGRCRRVVRELTGDLGACGGRVELFVEPLCAAAPCWLIGAGHIGRALVSTARELPLHCVLVDDRPEYLAGVTGVKAVFAEPGELVDSGFRPDRRTAVVIASRDHRLDEAYLQAVLEAEQAAGCEIAYLGVVGSARKANEMRGRLEQAGWSRERLARVRIPVGLEIGAETPAEIAISILAELLAELRGAALLLDAAEQPIGLPLRRRRDAARRSEPV
jgi:xanthine dehydrogenase accessory factor